MKEKEEIKLLPHHENLPLIPKDPILNEIKTLEKQTYGLEFIPHTKIMDGYQKDNPRYKQIYKSPQNDSLSYREVYEVNFSGNFTDHPKKMILKCIVMNIVKNKFIEKFIERLDREFYIGKTLGELCPYVAKTFDMKRVDISKSNEIIIEMLMEYGGISLSNLIKEIKSESYFLRIIHQLITALGQLEKFGIAHFDIKPLNIVWNKDSGMLKIIDFGTSISFYASPQILGTQINEFSDRITGFTDPYAPPELFKCIKERNFKTIVPQKFDVFSFGMTFCELLLKISNCKNDMICLNRNYEDINDFLQKIEVIIEKDMNQTFWLELFKACLNEDPEKRPTFKEVSEIFNKILILHFSDLKKIIEENNAQSIQINHKKIAETYFSLKQYDVSAWHYELHFSGVSNKLIENVDFIRTFVEMIVSKLLVISQINFEEYMKKSYDLYQKLSGNLLIDYLAIRKELHEKLENLVTSKQEIIYRCFDKTIIENFVQKIEEIKETKGIYHTDLAIIFDNIGTIYLLESDKENAIEQYKNSLDIRIKAYGETHIEVAKLYEKLGKVIPPLNQIDNHIEYLTKSCIIKEKVLGENSSEVANSYHELVAELFKCSKSYKEIESYFVKLIEMKKKVFGEKSEEVGREYYFCAKRLEERKDYVKVIEFQAKYIETIKEIQYAILRYDLLVANCIDWGFEEKAEEFIKIATELRKIYFTQQTEQIGLSYKSVGKKYYEKHNYWKAIDYYEKAISSISTADSNNLEIVNCYEGIASCYDSVGKYSGSIREKATSMMCAILVQNIVNVKVSYDKKSNEFEFENKLFHGELCNKPFKFKIKLDNIYDDFGLRIAFDNIGLEFEKLDNTDLAIGFYLKEAEIIGKIEGENSEEKSKINLKIDNLLNNNNFKCKNSNTEQQIFNENSKSDCEKPNDKEKLGEYYESIKEFDKAIEIYDKNIGEKIKIIDENNHEIADSYDNLASKCATLGIFNKAIYYSNLAVKIRRKILGENHPELSKSFENIGKICLDAENLEKSLEFYEKAFEIKEKAIGKNRIELADILEILVTIYEKINNFDKAKNAANYAKKIRFENMNENYIESAELYEKYGEKYENINKIDFALEYYEKSLKIKKKIFGENTNNFIDTLIDFGEKCKRMKLNIKSIEIYQNASEISEKVNGEFTRLSYILYEQIGDIYLSDKKYEDALINFIKSLNISYEIFQDDNWTIAIFHYKIGKCYENLGKRQLAVDKYCEAGNILEFNLIPEKEGLEIYKKLIDIYTQANEISRAEYFQKLLAATESMRKLIIENHKNIVLIQKPKSQSIEYLIENESNENEEFYFENNEIQENYSNEKYKEDENNEDNLEYEKKKNKKKKKTIIIL